MQSSTFKGEKWLNPFSYLGEEKTIVGESKLSNTSILLCFARINMLQSQYSLSAQHRKIYTGIDAYIFFNSA